MSPPPSHRLGINALPEHSPQVIHPSAQKRNSANVAKKYPPVLWPVADHALRGDGADRTSS
jgi:hypothetical protein